MQLLPNHSYNPKYYHLCNRYKIIYLFLTWEHRVLTKTVERKFFFSIKTKKHERFFVPRLKLSLL